MKTETEGIAGYLTRYKNLLVIGQIGQRVCECYDFAQLTEIEMMKRVHLRKNLMQYGRAMTIVTYSKIGLMLWTNQEQWAEFHLANILDTLVGRGDCTELQLSLSDEFAEER